MEKTKIVKKIDKESNEFKKFAFKGNIFDLAVGVIIGSAFSTLVSSVVQNIFMPPIGYLTSKVDFNSLYIALGSTKYDSLQQALDSGAVVIKYGEVISTFISFIITALVVYIFIYKVQQSFKKEEVKEKRSTKRCPYCMSKIHIKATRCPMCTSKLEN